jgi:hypothetical protein
MKKDNTPLEKKRTWHDPDIFVRSGVDTTVTLKNVLDNNVTAFTQYFNDTKTATDVQRLDKKLWRRLARPVVKLIFKLLKPIFLPIAVRWRAYLMMTITTELRKNADMQAHRLALLQKNIFQELDLIREAINRNSQK